MKTRLIHITPELPPTVGGIADYTAILSQRLVEVSDRAVEPVLVSAGKASDELPDVDFEYVDHGGTYSAEALCATIKQLTSEASGPAVILLQYSGYGYAPRGAPLWLLRALQQVCEEEGVPLITMFHEVRARDWRPWTSTFWLSPVQTYVARGLTRLSRALMTNHETAAQRLRTFTSSEMPVRVYPVFSNIGEPECATPAEDRSNEAVVFGGEGMKSALYDTHRDVLAAWLSKNKVDKIVDVGRVPSSKDVRLPADIEWRGIQPQSAISALLRDARFGILHYPAAYITKSGIMAAYMAHGTAPVVVVPQPEGGALTPNVHYIPVTANQASGDTESSAIADAAATWYANYAHSRHTAKAVYGMIRNIESYSVSS